MLQIPLNEVFIPGKANHDCLLRRYQIVTIPPLPTMLRVEELNQPLWIEACIVIVKTILSIGFWVCLGGVYHVGIEVGDLE